MNLPSAFAEQTKRLLGEEEYLKLEEALQEDSPVSIRLNEAKQLSDHPLSDIHCRLTEVPWCASGFYLDERLTFTFDPLFHTGRYYVQEASSMFVEQAILQYVHEPSVMLDLCAAPGGKSTHARSVLPEGSLLVANEVIRNRSQILAENLIKWGHPDMAVTNNDPADFACLPEFFDVILTDVPCSGEGMFRKDAGAIEEWSPDNVRICWQRQRRILTDIWESLKPGGILIYSTCTYNSAEDEENVAWIAEKYQAEVLPIAIDPHWGITGNLLDNELPVYHFLPHKTKGEGFFLAVLRKPGMPVDGIDYTGIPSGKKKKGVQAKTPSVPKEAYGWLLRPEQFTFEIKGNMLTAFNREHAAKYAALQALKVVHTGIIIGELKGKDLIPNHSLAMSQAFNRTAFPSAELTYEQAIAYLRKEAITLDTDIPKGYVTVTYQDIPLGFVKNIGNRANNLYPNEWRIRSGYLPEEVKCI